LGVTIKDNSGDIRRQIKDAIIRGLERCGMEAEGIAKANLTKNESVVTGNLRNSITHKVNTSEPAVYIGTNTEYAVYVELGTGEHAEGGGGRPTPWVYQDDKGNWHHTHGQRAKPYLRPALADHKKTYKNILEDELKHS
jgi:HK97 gp10 family phage protein